MLLHFNTVLSVTHICVQREVLRPPTQVWWLQHRLGCARPPPGSPVVEGWGPPQSHPKLPLLLEIGIKPGLGVFHVPEFDG